MTKFKFTFLLIAFVLFSSEMTAQRKIEKLVEDAIQEAEQKQRKDGKFLVADFSDVPKTKVIPPEVVKRVIANRYGYRDMRTVRRTVYGKIQTHVIRFEFRDLELLRQDKIEKEQAKIAAAADRERAIAARKRYQDSMAQVKKLLLDEMNEDRAKHLPGLWLSNMDEVIEIREDGTLNMVQLKGEQQRLRVYWKYDPATNRFLISNNGVDFTNLGVITYTETDTALLYRFDGKKYTMSHTSVEAIRIKLESEALAKMFLESMGGQMSRDEEYDQYLYWRQRGIY